MSDLYKNVREIDPAMAFHEANENGVAWYLPFEKPMKMTGFSWFSKDKAYERLPLERPEEVTQFILGEKKKISSKKCGALLLSVHTAGGQVHFRTNSTKFLIHAKLCANNLMDHMAYCGTAGFDLYLKDNGVWKSLGSTRIKPESSEYKVTIAEGIRSEMRDVVINFPLYAGVSFLSIGLEENARVEAPTPFADDKPVVWYGTSITQGGCASRPGMAASNILSRLLNQEVINLGFSGSGKGEPEIAQMLADIPDPALYLIDYAWNVGVKELSMTLDNLVSTIRKNHPTTPLVLMPRTPGKAAFEFMPNFETFAQQSEIMQAEVAKRQAAGDPNIRFFDALTQSLGEDFWECLVDGCHLTDLGFYRLAHTVYQFIQSSRILG